MQRSGFYIYRRKLPHWRADYVTYFVTWRLDNAQRPLTPAERSLVKSALLNFDGQRYDLYAYVVMDDHIHTLVTPLNKEELQTIMHSWRSFTTHALQRNHGRSGRVWQRNYFDRIVRNSRELAEKTRYILHNPWKRWPNLEEYVWVGYRTRD